MLWLIHLLLKGGQGFESGQWCPYQPNGRNGYLVLSGTDEEKAA